MAAPGDKGKTGGGGGAPADEKKESDKPAALDSSDIQLLKSYGAGPYAASIKRLEADIVDEMKAVNELIGACRRRVVGGGGGEHGLGAHPHTAQGSRRARQGWRRPASGTSSATRR